MPHSLNVICNFPNLGAQIGSSLHVRANHQSHVYSHQLYNLRMKQDWSHWTYRFRSRTSYPQQEIALKPSQKAITSDSFLKIRSGLQQTQINTATMVNCYKQEQLRKSIKCLTCLTKMPISYCGQ